MENQISTATPETTDTVNQTSEAVEVVSGNGQSSGEAMGQSATAGETFIPKDVDLNTLPPEVRAYIKEVDKKMVRGFTEKTMKHADTVKSEVSKATEAYKEKAEMFEKIAAQKEFVQQWNEYVQKANAAENQSANALPPEIRQRLEKVDHIERKLQEAEAGQVIDAFSEATDEKGNKLHPNFDKYHEIVLGTHPQSGEYSLLRAAIELAQGKTYQEKIENGYKSVEAVYKGIFEEGKKAGMGRLQQKVQNGSFAPSGINAGNTAPNRPKNALEALQFARQGLAVHE